MVISGVFMKILSIDAEILDLLYVLGYNVINSMICFLEKKITKTA